MWGGLILYLYYFNKQKKLIQSKINKESTNNPMPQWRRFERRTGMQFHQNWRKVRLWETWKKDDWKDIVIEKNKKRFLIQCKRRFGRKRVTTKEIREFQWSIDFYNKKYNENAQGIFITTWWASPNAKNAAKQLGIQLRSAKDDNLLTKIRTFTG